MKIIDLKKFVLAFVALNVMGSNISASNRYVPSEHVILADQITDQVKRKILEKYKDLNMRHIGGGGRFVGGVNLLSLDFTVRGPVCKDELRRMLIYSVEEYLTCVNANEKVRPFLKIYPFTHNEIEIGLFIRNRNGGELFDPDISIANFYLGKLHYDTIDGDNVLKYKNEYEESYEEAKRIVQSTQKD